MNNEFKKVVDKKGNPVYVLLRSELNKESYDIFDSYIGAYVNKTKPFVQKILQKILSTKCTTFSISAVPNNYVYSDYYSPDEDKTLSLILLNIQLLEILPPKENKFTIDTPPEDLANAILYSFVTFIVNSNRIELYRDFDLNGLLIHFLVNMIVNSLELFHLNDSQMELLTACVGILYFKHYHENDTLLARENTFKSIANMDENLFKKSSDDFTLINKYSDIKDVFKIIYDLRLVFETPNVTIAKIFRKISISPFMAIISNYSSLIATIIASQYPGLYFEKVKQKNNTANGVTNIIEPYIGKVKFSSFVFK